MTDEARNQIIKILMDCSWKKTATFNYQNSKGVKSAKLVEVYDLDLEKGKFYGYELPNGPIKQFSFDSLKNFIEPGEEFAPRFEKK